MKRWKERLENFEHAFYQLKEVYENPDNGFDNMTFEEMRYNTPKDLKATLIIKLFEIAYELSYKLMASYFFSEGIIVKNVQLGVKEIFQKAYNYGLIPDEKKWLEFITLRNETAHEYNNNVHDFIESMKDKETIKYFEMFLDEMTKRKENE